MTNTNEKQSFVKRNWKWIVPIITFLILAIAIYSVLGEAINAFGAAYTHPEIVDKAFEKAATDPKVVALFGDPLAKKSLIEGEVRIEDDGNTMKIYQPIKGSERHGMLDIIATKEGDSWNYEYILVRTKGKTKETIELLNSKD